MIWPDGSVKQVALTSSNVENRESTGIRLGRTLICKISPRKRVKLARINGIGLLTARPGQDPLGTLSEFRAPPKRDRVTKAKIEEGKKGGDFVVVEQNERGAGDGRAMADRSA